MVSDMAPTSPDLQGRKLAVIVAIDMVGYSARVEADETGALGDLDRLRTLIARLAADHGGRVFNSAGDGFMLEFPTASGAFDLAEALAAQAPAAVRIGVHLGEVRQAPDGDLLGHGVNVAARIQAKASPNAPLFSADARRALRGDRAARLRARGLIALDKMSERIEVFGFADPASGPARPRLSPRLLRWGGLAILAVLAVLLSMAVWRGSSHPARLALLAFDAGGDPGAAAFARGLQDDIQAQVLPIKAT
ncbi:adenylate/guanylate cyclase domain-containing protein [Phenylobacterium aquaticum]|uniref:adenylate/guanylate cyclase domain-containing protein n=1 Tax=Phenylobacterium aquaticum TaxID=1763816 RepID=UPI001F5C6EE7|nr:adenylate/guanylate cyclase domain-containing protein [Phenylobacterium aquaticum]MCI3133618.1 adenylate/guanylate cyclase domain-containing protein [Phenylobacterium aquaticum]